MWKLFWLLASADCLEVGRLQTTNPFSGQANYTESCTDYWGHHCHSICVQGEESGACAGAPQTLGVSPPSRLNTVTNIFTTSPHKPSALHHQPQSTAWSFNQQFKTIIVNPVSTQGLTSVYLVDRETVAVEDPPITSQQSSSSQTNCHCLEPSSQTLSISISIWWRPSPESTEPDTISSTSPNLWSLDTRGHPCSAQSSQVISQYLSTVQHSTAQYSTVQLQYSHQSPSLTRWLTNWNCVRHPASSQPVGRDQWDGLSSHKHNTTPTTMMALCPQNISLYLFTFIHRKL